MGFLNSVSCPSKLNKPLDGVLGTSNVQSVRCTGNNLDFQLASEVGAVFWDCALDLWKLMLSLGRYCQN